MNAIQGLIRCTRCKGAGLDPKTGEPCPHCSTDEDRRYGMPGSGVEPESYRGCISHEDCQHE